MCASVYVGGNVGCGMWPVLCKSNEILQYFPFILRDLNKVLLITTMLLFLAVLLILISAHSVDLTYFLPHLFDESA